MQALFKSKKFSAIMLAYDIYSVYLKNDNENI